MALIGFLLCGTSWTYLTNSDEDPGRQGPCVVAAMDKFTQTTEILWRKKDGMATL